MVNSVKLAIVIVGCLIIGSFGWLGTSCANHLYQDHLLVDQARAVNATQQQQAAQAAQQRESQAAPAPAPQAVSPSGTTPK